MQAGISYGGREAERRFRDLTGASVASRSADGDAVLEGHNIEIKQASTNTLNQVRPVKYLPLVVLDTRSDKWYVVPPNQVVCLAAAKGRGQHTENPFESVTLSVAKMEEYKVEEQDLRPATLEAIQEGERNQSLKEAMREVRQRSSDLATWSKKYVLELL